MSGSEDRRLIDERFPRATKYHPEWMLAGISGGANSLWLTEWLADGLDLRPGQRVLDLGCGRGVSSIFLRKEFNVDVWATDLWFSPTERLARVRDAGVEDGVFPIHAEAHALPFATEFFDAIISIDSFMYYGTDDLYLSYLARFLKPGGKIGIAQSGFTQEIEGEVPEHLRAWWEPALWCLHSPAWWKRHWERTKIVDVEVADAMPDGWKRWLAWQHAATPDNKVELAAVEADQGRYLGYVRAIARRRADAKLDDPITSIPMTYEKKPLLR